MRGGVGAAWYERGGGRARLPVCVSMCLCSELAQGNTRGQNGHVIFCTELE